MHHMQRKNSIDMLNGPLLGKIIYFALPIAFCNILQQTFNATDTAVVGRFAGSQALAAVGSNGVTINILVNLFVGLSVGVNVLVARLIGHGDKDQVNPAIHTIMSMALIGGVILLAIGQLLSRPLLVLVATPDDVMPLAVVYLRIYFLGMPFFLIYNFGAAILRSNGDTKRPLISLFISGFLNLILNLILVCIFRMGVAGVGIATVISNIFSGTLVLIFLMREDEMLRFDPRKLTLQWKYMKEVLRVGVPTSIQHTAFAISNIVILSAINSFGSAASAGSAICLAIERNNAFIAQAFGQACVSFSSQNFGANRFDRVKRVFTLSLVTCEVSAFVYIGTCLYFRKPIISLFTTDPEVFRYAEMRILTSFALCFINSVTEISTASLRSIGYSLIPTGLTLLGTCVFRLFFIAFILPLNPTFAFLFWVYPTSWIITSASITAMLFLVRESAFRKKAAQNA